MTVLSVKCSSKFYLSPSFKPLGQNLEHGLPLGVDGYYKQCPCTESLLMLKAISRSVKTQVWHSTINFLKR